MIPFMPTETSRAHQTQNSRQCHSCQVHLWISDIFWRITREELKVSGTNGTAVRKPLIGLELGFCEFRPQFRARPLHERIALAAALQDARLDAAGPVGHFLGGDLGQHHVI